MKTTQGMRVEIKKHYVAQCPLGVVMRWMACGIFLLQSTMTTQRKRVTCKNCLNSKWFREKRK